MAVPRTTALQRRARLRDFPRARSSLANACYPVDQDPRGSFFGALFDFSFRRYVTRRGSGAVHGARGHWWLRDWRCWAR